MVEVWLLGLRPQGVDPLGRPRSQPGRVLLSAATATRDCPARSGQPCRPERLADSRSRCLDCGSWWSVSQVAHHGAVARASLSVGVDVEDRRCRPNALRRASRWCGVNVTTAEQWTQAEALWKAMGAGKRPPHDGEIPLAEAWQEGWQPSRDGAWWLRTESEPYPWSIALPHLGDSPPSVTFVSGLDTDGIAWSLSR